MKMTLEIRVFCIPRVCHPKLKFEEPTARKIMSVDRPCTVTAEMDSKSIFLFCAFYAYIATDLAVWLPTNIYASQY